MSASTYMYFLAPFIEKAWENLAFSTKRNHASSRASIGTVQDEAGTSPENKEVVKA